MKKKILYAFIGAMAITCVFKSNAQTGVTKYGTSALANNAVSGEYNTGLGYFVLAANTSGNRNTGSGANALRFNTTGVYNTATGAAALYQNTTGYYNTGFGTYTLFANTTGYQNTALGNEALRLNTTGNYNTAGGNRSLYNNTTGYFNNAFGANSLYSNTTGYQNTAIGDLSMFFNTTGLSNTAVGHLSLYKNTSGFSNTALGNEALRSNTIGYYNTANGSASLRENTTGAYNTANGSFSLYNNTFGDDNTANGNYSLYSNTTGSFNTANGLFSLFDNTTGNGNTAIGYNANVSAGNLTNATAIGYSTTVNASNKVRVGNSSVTSIGGQVGWTTFSDGRYKKDIQENVQGLAFINSLRPITYTVNVKGLNEFNNKTRKSATAGDPAENEDKAAKAEMEKAESEAAKIIYNGFVAQEVEQAAKKLNFEFSGVDKPATEDGLYGLRYDNFISPLVKAVQELSAKNDSLISDLQSQIDDLKALITKSSNGSISTSSTAAYLKQNAPNPFRSNSVISCYIPDDAGHAQIRITDAAGRVIKTFNPAKGEGQINIRSGDLAAGNYSYTLYINNKAIDTKKMVLLK